MSRPLRVMRLGRVPYMEALRLQHEIQEARAESETLDTLLLLEHDPVITLGRRGKAENILVPGDRLKTMGVDVIEVERGGDVTFHGPGQLIAYPIIGLEERSLGPVDFIRVLEQVIIKAMRPFAISGSVNDKYTGVWVGDEKVAAIGVSVKKGVSCHGLALNVNVNLDYFSLIVPCGIRDHGVTSMQKILGQTVPMDQVQGSLTQCFIETLGFEAISDEP